MDSKFIYSVDEILAIYMFARSLEYPEKSFKVIGDFSKLATPIWFDVNVNCLTMFTSLLLHFTLWRVKERKEDALRGLLTAHDKNNYALSSQLNWNFSDTQTSLECFPMVTRDHEGLILSLLDRG